MNKLKFIKSALLVSLGAVLLGSCMKDDGPDQEPSPVYNLAIFNGYPDAESVTPRINGQDINSIKYDGTWGNSNNPNPIGGTLVFQVGQQQRLSATNPTTKQILIPEFTFTPKDQGLYTWLVYGEEEDAQSILIEDVISTQQPTTAKIRFFNLANGTGEVDVFLGDTPIGEFASRDQDDQASAVQNGKFIDKPSGSSNTIVVKAEDGTELKSLSNYDFRDIYYYTIVLVGNPAPSSGEDAKHSYVIKVFPR